MYSDTVDIYGTHMAFVSLVSVRMAAELFRESPLSLGFNRKVRIEWAALGVCECITGESIELV